MCILLNASNLALHIHIVKCVYNLALHIQIVKYVYRFIIVHRIVLIHTLTHTLSTMRMDIRMPYESSSSNLSHMNQLLHVFMSIRLILVYSSRHTFT